MSTSTSARPRVVIIGAGFAGLYAAKELAGSDLDVTIVDRKNHHTFQPLLYQVATAALNPSDVATPIRSILSRHSNIRVILGDARSIDTAERKVVLDEGELDYDYLLVATGVTHTWFGNDQWAEHAPGLKTIEDALEIRKRMLLAFEAAERETDPEVQKEWLTFVVVGAGPTGVEMAGAISEIARHTLVSDFRRIDPADARVLLVEALDEVLPPYPPDLSASAERQLKNLEVEVMTGTRVEQIDSETVTLSNGKIRARTVVWAAGVAASSLGKSLDAPLDDAGRVRVEDDLSIPGAREVFVAGDLVALEDDDGEPIPGIAPAAIQEGRHAARNILRLAAGRPTEPFAYQDKGMMATIGRAAAVARLGNLHLSGFLAWMIWLGVHIFFLIGFRNRFLVIAQWAWAYISWARGARLITGVDHVPVEDPVEDE